MYFIMIEQFVYLLAYLIGIHYLCDFPLQGDFIARYKARWVNDGPNDFWVHCLVAHCAIHSLGVLLITGDLLASLIMFASHALIDFLKCEGKLSFTTDQLLHLLVIVLIAVLCVV